jgi:hypothetical protein
LDYGRSTTFGVSLEGVTQQDAGIHKFCTTVAIARTLRGAKWLSMGFVVDLKLHFST